MKSVHRVVIKSMQICTKKFITKYSTSITQLQFEVLVTMPYSACKHQSQGHGISGALKLLLKPKASEQCSEFFGEEHAVR